MTREQLEAIVALDPVKYGSVRIELRYLGYVIVAQRGKLASEFIISFLEAEEARYPIELFETTIALVIARSKSPPPQ